MVVALGVIEFDFDCMQSIILLQPINHRESWQAYTVYSISAEQY